MTDIICKPIKNLQKLGNSWNADACHMHLLHEGTFGTEIIIGGLRAPMKLLSSMQAQVIQSLVTFQHSSGDSFPVESPRSEDRKRRNEAPEKI